MKKTKAVVHPLRSGDNRASVRCHVITDDVSGKLHPQTGLFKFPASCMILNLSKEGLRFSSSKNIKDASLFKISLPDVDFLLSFDIRSKVKEDGKFIYGVKLKQSIPKSFFLYLGLQRDDIELALKTESLITEE